MYRILNDDKCLEIINKYNNGINRNILSKEYGVSHRTITNILERNLTNRNRGNKKYTVNENYFDEIDTENKAYWLGFLYADGYILERGKALITGLTLKDLDHIEKFKSDIDSTHLIKSTTTNNYQFNIYNTNFSKHLIDKGCIPRKTNKIEFPEIKNDLVNHFIRGYFDGDGSVSATDRTLQVTICCASKIFLENLIKKISDETGVRNKIYTREDGLHLYVNASGDDILEIGRYLYKNSNKYLDRKKKIFDFIEKNINEIKKKVWKNNWEMRKKRNTSME